MPRIYPENDNWNVVEDVETASIYHAAKLQKQKLKKYDFQVEIRKRI
jgi:hypothetical protein